MRVQNRAVAQGLCENTLVPTLVRLGSAWFRSGSAWFWAWFRLVPALVLGLVPLGSGPGSGPGSAWFWPWFRLWFRLVSVLVLGLAPLGSGSGSASAWLRRVDKCNRNHSQGALL